MPGTMRDAFIGRQAIHDRHQTVFGCELAFEQGDHNGLPARDIHAAEANAAYLEAVRWNESIRARW